MKKIKDMTATECNARIRELQKEMSTANENERDKIRSLIALLAKEAAFKNRNVLTTRIAND